MSAPEDTAGVLGVADERPPSTITSAAATSPRVSASAPWRRLLVATPVGWALGIVAGVMLIVLVESLGVRELQSPLVIGVALGVSGLQYRALRAVLSGSRRRWVILSCLGLSAPFLVADAATMTGRAPEYDLITFMITGGVVASVLQWHVLRPVVEGAAGWLLASPAGYGAAAVTVWLNDRVLPKTPGIVGALQYLGVILCGGVLLGVVTALAASRFRPRLRTTDLPIFNA